MPVDRYRVILTRAAVRDVIDLQTYLVEVMEAILSLRDDPLRGHMLTGTLKGARTLEFSLPGGAYRAAYRLEATAKLCRVFAVQSDFTINVEIKNGAADMTADS